MNGVQEQRKRELDLFIDSYCTSHGSTGYGISLIKRSSSRFNKLQRRQLLIDLDEPSLLLSSGTMGGVLRAFGVKRPNKIVISEIVDIILGSNRLKEEKEERWLTIVTTTRKLRLKVESSGLRNRLTSFLKLLINMQLGDIAELDRHSRQSKQSIEVLRESITKARESMSGIDSTSTGRDSIRRISFGASAVSEQHWYQDIFADELKDLTDAELRTSMRRSACTGPSRCSMRSSLGSMPNRDTVGLGRYSLNSVWDARADDSQPDTSRASEVHTERDACCKVAAVFVGEILEHTILHEVAAQVKLIKVVKNYHAERKLEKDRKLQAEKQVAKEFEKRRVEALRKLAPSTPKQMSKTQVHTNATELEVVDCWLPIGLADGNSRSRTEQQTAPRNVFGFSESFGIGKSILRSSTSVQSTAPRTSLGYLDALSLHISLGLGGRPMETGKP